MPDEELSPRPASAPASSRAHERAKDDTYGWIVVVSELTGRNARAIAGLLERTGLAHQIDVFEAEAMAEQTPAEEPQVEEEPVPTADDRAVEKLREIGRRPNPDRRMAFRDYEIRVVGVIGDRVDVELLNRAEEHGRVLLPLPSRSGDAPWSSGPITDDDEWMTTMLIWLDEAVFSGGLSANRTRSSRQGVLYLVIDDHGFRLTETARANA